ncbi:MAG: hypothetical protein HYV09_31385 [Deltaproteobacteria bacterium]|nr:hypothetical protein [Deltaproteobacteria bacterium]
MSAPWFPAPPEVPADQRASGALELRYEDLAQDGRAMLESLPHAIGEVVWRQRLSRQEHNRTMLRQGVIPILTRLVVEASDEPLPITHPIDAAGMFDLAHAIDGKGDVERLLLDIWIEVHGVRGRTNFPPQPGDGARVSVGRVFAEHVFTRPWGPPEERKVKRLPNIEGLPEIPQRRRDFRALPQSAGLPIGATLLDADPVVDPSPIVFGLVHTDANQHVNSLVYLRMFEEALVRRAAAHRLPPDALARWIEIGYRKPCFAGDRVRVRLQLYTRSTDLGDEIGAVGAFVPEDDPTTDKPYAWVAMGARRAR